jgi:hypothetical protein
MTLTLYGGCLAGQCSNFDMVERRESGRGCADPAFSKGSWDLVGQL